jgi:hypothetical protein
MNQIFDERLEKQAEVDVARQLSEGKSDELKL